MQKTLVKAIELLEFMTTGKQRYGVSELAQALNLYKSNVHEILSTFEALGYVSQDPETKKYSLTMKVLELGHRIRSRFGILEVLGVMLQKLSDDLGELSYFGMLYGHSLMYMCGGFPRTDVTAKPVVGMVAPLYCTAMGKVILANSKPEIFDQVVADGLKPFTQNTITDSGALREEIMKTRKAGYACNNMEHDYGLSAVAVPVFASSGKFMGAVNVSGPSPRFTSESVGRFVDRLHATASQIEASYGSWS
jgi:IclR family KDG regulon transcriptional repressor